MSIWVQTLRSGSSGNAVLVGCGTTTVLVDCGVTAKRTMNALLDAHVAMPGGLSAAVITHNHGDHCHPAALAVLQERDVPVFSGSQVYRHVRGQMKFREKPLRTHKLEAGEGAGMGVGELKIECVEVEHSANTQTMAYRFTAVGGATLVYATDLCEERPIRKWLVDSDLVVLEANHCPRLLQLFPNYASRFHLSNPKAGLALAEARKERAASGRGPWRAVVLAHLSEKRNTPELATGAIGSAFEKAGLTVDFPLVVAPRYEVGERIESVGGAARREAPVRVEVFGRQLELGFS